jgi:hypothetical protein
MSSTMAEHRYRERQKVEQQLVRLELADGWTKIACRLILALLAVAATAASILCAVHNLPWPIPTSLVTLSALSGVASIRDHH